MGLGGQGQAPAALPPGKTLGTHFTRGWVDPRCRSGRVRKNSPLQGFDPRAKAVSNNSNNGSKHNQVYLLNKSISNKGA
jgi:hypothetical protein